MEEGIKKRIIKLRVAGQSITAIHKTLKEDGVKIARSSVGFACKGVGPPKLELSLAPDKPVKKRARTRTKYFMIRLTEAEHAAMSGHAKGVPLTIVARQAMEKAGLFIPEVARHEG